MSEYEYDLDFYEIGWCNFVFGVEIPVKDIAEFISILSYKNKLLCYAVIGNYYEIPEEIEQDLFQFERDEKDLGAFYHEGTVINLDDSLLSLIASVDDSDFEGIIVGKRVRNETIRAGAQERNISTCVCKDLGEVQKEVLAEFKRIGYTLKTTVGLHITTNYATS